MRRLKKLLKRLRRHLHQPRSLYMQILQNHFFLEADASNFELGSVLSQYGEDG
jgi:hypothetical protein